MRLWFSLGFVFGRRIMPISLQQSNAAFSSAFRAPDDQVWHTTLAGIVGQGFVTRGNFLAASCAGFRIELGSRDGSVHSVCRLIKTDGGDFLLNFRMCHLKCEEWGNLRLLRLLSLLRYRSLVTQET